MFDLIIDNTGFHAAARCLDNSSVKNGDIQSLLNLASQIVFSDSIRISTFETSGVSNRTDEILGSLSKFQNQSQKSLISRLGDPSNYYFKCATKVGKDLADELAVGFSLHKTGSMKGFHLESTPERVKAIDKQTATIKNMQNLHPADRDEKIQIAREAKAGDIPVYAVLSSQDLYEQICDFQSHTEWKNSHTLLLSHMIRFRLYQEIATVCDPTSELKAVYSPAYSRGRIMRSLSGANVVATNLPTKISNQLNQLKSELPNIGFGLPTVATALIKMSDGDPIRLIEKSFELNAQSKSLRDSLRKRIPAGNFRSAESARKTRKILENTALEFNEYLNRSLNLQQNFSKIEAIKLVAGICTIPLGRIVSYLGGALGSNALKTGYEAMEHKVLDVAVRNRKFSALTTIVLADDWAKDNPLEFKKLYNKIQLTSRHHN